MKLSKTQIALLNEAVHNDGKAGFQWGHYTGRKLYADNTFGRRKYDAFKGLLDAGLIRNPEHYSSTHQLIGTIAVCHSCDTAFYITAEGMDALAN